MKPSTSRKTTKDIAPSDEVETKDRRRRPVLSNSPKQSPKTSKITKQSDGTKITNHMSKVLIAATDKKDVKTSKIYANVDKIRDNDKRKDKDRLIDKAKVRDVEKIKAKDKVKDVDKVIDKSKIRDKVQARDKGAKLTKDLPFLNVTVNSPVKKKKDLDVRQRTNTKTLKPDEVKVLKNDVDNNLEMNKLKNRLAKDVLPVARPKAYFIDLNDGNKDPKEIDDGDYSYEDDFESYESDFDSCTSSAKSKASSDISDRSNVEKDIKKPDEEKQLDSGNYDLKETLKSLDKAGNTLRDIKETLEENNYSLSDEGFIESNSLLGRSKDEIEKSQSKHQAVRNRSKASARAIRAKEIANKTSLEAFTYSLIDLPPIPFDTFVEIYGNSGKSHKNIQTFDDGICAQTQTDVIGKKTKWTQKPVEFSHSDVHKLENDDKTVISDNFDYLKDSLISINDPVSVDVEESSLKHLSNYVEQKNGCGDAGYVKVPKVKQMLGNAKYDANNLKAFLSKFEKPVCNILRNNKHIALSNSNINFFDGVIEHKFNGDLNVKNGVGIMFSEDASYVLTVHNDSLEYEDFKTMAFDEVMKRSSFLCLWDVNADFRLCKVCIALSCIAVSDFCGGVEGLIVAALDDGCLYAWDLSQASSPSQSDSSPGYLHCCYSSCGRNEVAYGRAVSVKILKDNKENFGTKVYLLYEQGTITIWNLINDDAKSDLGRAVWSKISLTQISYINLYNYIDSSTSNSVDFNLNLAKKRAISKRDVRSKTSKFDKSSESIDNEAGAARSKKYEKMLPALEIIENGLICTDMVVERDGVGTERLLVAKNCGEVLYCVREYGRMKVIRFCLSEPTTTITSLTAAPCGDLSYFLAGTDSGYVHLYSTAGRRVALTVHSRNVRNDRSDHQDAVKSLFWRENDCCSFVVVTRIGFVCLWNLGASDIYATSVSDCGLGAVAVGFGRCREDEFMVLLTRNGLIRVNRFKKCKDPDKNRELLERYLTLL